ncbi:MAG: hypothetical protein M0R21_04630 [Lentimicrobiaceae bacterium]|nr:hypothetical protein [Lentimicrobiaceae bacterium]
MPYILRPNNDTDRNSVINRMFELIFTSQGEIREDATKIFLNDTIEHLKNFMPVYSTAYKNRNLAFSDRSSATKQKNVPKDLAKKIILHFFHTFNYGIERGTFNISERRLYGLDIESMDIPSLITESDILEWGDKIVGGEATRIAQGGKPMAMPSAEEVRIALENYKVAQKQKSEKQIGLTKEQEEIQKLRDEADDLIKDLWDEVEFYFRKSEPAARRVQCSQWGVIYKNRYGDNGDNTTETNPTVTP